jgi:O-glycosyl hydrolase
VSSLTRPAAECATIDPQRQYQRVRGYGMIIRRRTAWRGVLALSSKKTSAARRSAGRDA